MVNYLIILFLLVFSVGFTEEKESIENQYIEALALTFQEYEKEGSEAIWPNFHFTDKPVLFHFQNGHVYAFGLKNSPLWEKRTIQHHPVLFCAKYPISLAPLQPDFPLEKQRAFVMSLDQGDNQSYFPLLTFIHERFHIHQFQFFKKERVVEGVVADYQNIDLLALMELEHQLLTLFLQANESESKLQHLKNYVAVNQTRRHLLHLDSIQWEDHQQKMEGLADYVSAKTFQIFPHIPNFNAEEYLLEMRKKKDRGLIYSAQDAIKGRHYFVGAVLGWALDFCEVENWKFKIEKENISLQALLENVLPMEKEESQQRLLNVRKLLNVTEIQAKIEQQIEKENKDKAEMLQVFDVQEGVVIKMSTPSGRMSSGGRHQKSCQVDNKKALMQDTSIAVSQDRLWTLRFTSIPLVFEEQNGDRIFKLNSGDILHLDGNEISLQDILQGDHKEVHFREISLKTKHCELISMRPGKLCIEQGTLSFKFK